MQNKKKYLVLRFVKTHISLKRSLFYGPQAGEVLLIYACPSHYPSICLHICI